MGIGDALAEARRQAGLTITQVSQRTCIRETIIGGIERGDYSACGGDFYARGHIRSIAHAVRVDPDPLISDYDASQGAPQQLTAAEVFEPSTPIKIRERRRLNLSFALAAVLLAAVGYGIYHFTTRPQHSTATAVAAAGVPGTRHPRHQAAAARQPAPPGPHQLPHVVMIRLTAASDCWVQLSTAAGRKIFSGVVYGGATRQWTEHRAVRLILGNPGGVTVTVNGKNAVPANSASQPVTLTLPPHQRTAG